MSHSWKSLSPRHKNEVPQSQDTSHPHVPEATTMTVEDLLYLVPNLITKVDSLETELKQTKLTMGKEIVKLVKKVKKLEAILKRRHVVLTDSEDEEPEDQGRIFQDINDDPQVASQKSKSVDKGKRYKRRKESKGKYISTGFEDISTGFEEVNTGFEKATSSLEVSTGSGPVRSARSQREGKAPIILKKLKFEEIKEEFEKLVKQIDTFVPINIEATKAQLKRYREELQTEISKKQRIDDKDVLDTEEKVGKVKEEEPVKRVGKRKKQKARKGISIDKSPQGDSETDKEESVEAMNPTPLDTKSNIKYGTNRPEDAYDRVLWSDLRTMFDPPLNEDAIWSLPLQQKMISWRYYDKCAVHCLTLEACNIYMLADRKYPLSKDACQVMLKMKLLDGKMNEVCYKLLKMIEKQAGVKK
ncbi:hypothetical protein Tco_1547910 [Tanacetum coccineum]